MKSAYGSLIAAGRLAVTIIVLSALTACFGSDGNNKKYSIGGDVTGLTGTVVLQNNGGDNLSVNANGAFKFAKKVKKKKGYAVTVLTQPTGQTCTVTNGSGTVSANVTDVAVACTTNVTFSVGGNVSGLTGTVVLRNNGGDNLSVSANGAFTFATRVASGGAYAVTVLTQPAGQTCTVASGSGTANANVTNVAVTCTTNPTFSIGGSVSGLSGTVVLRNNGGDNLSVSANGAFTFATRVASGGAYAVTVLTQPAGQTCTVTNGAGTASVDVTTVTVTCAVIVVTTYTIGGNVTGLTSGTVVLQNNGGDNLSVSATGAFAFPTKLANGVAYTVTVLTQPAGQSCAVTNGAGTVAAANVANVSVSCSSTSTLYSIGGTITGLKGAGLKIEDGSTNFVTPAASATTFTLPDKKQNNFEYEVGISAQPTGQTCVLIKSHGVINSADVTNVDVRCIDNVTSPLVGTYTVPALVPDSYVYITFFADGVYVYGSVENNGGNCGTTNDGNGVEYGVYNYNATTHAFTIKSAVVDTNGGCGVWANGAARYAGTLTVAGSGQLTVLTLAVAGGAQTFDLVPVDSASGQIKGGWAFPYHKNFAVFLPAGGSNLYYMITETQADTAPTSTGYLAGFEYACASFTGGTLTPDLTATCQAPAPSVNGPVDTNGTSGLSNAGGPVPVTISVDTLTSGDLVLTRSKPN
jgi:hypothetical protein